MTAPTITQISPNYGSFEFQPTVTITGTSFVNGINTVYFGTNSVTASYVSATEIMAVVPLSVGPGAVGVYVVNTNGTSLLSPATYYYYLAVNPPSAVYSALNPFFDPNAAYNTFGPWSAQNPYFALPGLTIKTSDGGTYVNVQICTVAGTASQIGQLFIT